MKPYLGRILICVVPVARRHRRRRLGLLQYTNGEGGFRLGVDLVGGTILVYEVDTTQDRQARRTAAKPDELAAALKRRIDPGRPVQRHHPARARRPAARRDHPADRRPAPGTAEKRPGRTCSKRSKQISAASDRPNPYERHRRCENELARSTTSASTDKDARAIDGHRRHRRHYHGWPTASSADERGSREHQEPDPAAGPAGVPHPGQPHRRRRRHRTRPRTTSKTDQRRAGDLDAPASRRRRRRNAGRRHDVPVTLNGETSQLQL